MKYKLFFWIIVFLSSSIIFSQSSVNDLKGQSSIEFFDRSGGSIKINNADKRLSIKYFINFGYNRNIFFSIETSGNLKDSWASIFNSGTINAGASLDIKFGYYLLPSKSIQLTSEEISEQMKIPYFAFNLIKLNLRKIFEQNKNDYYIYDKINNIIENLAEKLFSKIENDLKNSVKSINNKEMTENDIADIIVKHKSIFKNNIKSYVFNATLYDFKQSVMSFDNDISNMYKIIEKKIADNQQTINDKIVPSNIIKDTFFTSTLDIPKEALDKIEEIKFFSNPNRVDSNNLWIIGGIGGHGEVFKLYYPDKNYNEQIEKITFTFLKGSLGLSGKISECIGLSWFFGASYGLEQTNNLEDLKENSIESVQEIVDVSTNSKRTIKNITTAYSGDYQDFKNHPLNIDIYVIPYVQEWIKDSGNIGFHSYFRMNDIANNKIQKNIGFGLYFFKEPYPLTPIAGIIVEFPDVRFKNIKIGLAFNVAKFDF